MKVNKYVTPKLYHVFVIMMFFTMLSCCVSESENDHPIGGCKYVADTGFVKFIGYGDTLSGMKQVIFNFYSKKISRLPIGIFYDTNCINLANLKPDTEYSAIRNSLIEGSCAGDGYEISSINCNN